MAILLPFPAALSAQAAAGDVTLEMADGTTKRGYCRTDMINDVNFFELSAEPRGERTRYDNDQIARIVFDDGTVYVKKDHINTRRGHKAENGWLRVDYTGNGIALYSKHWYGRRSDVWIGYRYYYIALRHDPAVWVSIQYDMEHSGQAIADRRLLKDYFARYPQYADFAKRFADKEFDVEEPLINVVKAWEEAYGGQ